MQNRGIKYLSESHPRSVTQDHLLVSLQQRPTHTDHELNTIHSTHPTHATKRNSRNMSERTHVTYM